MDVLNTSFNMVYMLPKSCICQNFRDDCCFKTFGLCCSSCKTVFPVLFLLDVGNGSRSRMQSRASLGVVLREGVVLVVIEQHNQ